MPFKKTEDGNIVAKNGLPIFIDAAGKESAFDPAVPQAQIKKLSARLVKNAFDNSKFINERTKFPGEIFEAMFGERFNVDGDGRVVGQDAQGMPLFSHVRFGEVANFDEAFETILGAYAHRDTVMKQPGTAPANGGDPVGGNIIKRSQLDAMRPAARAAFFAAGGTLIDDDGPSPKATTTAPVAPLPGSSINRQQFDALTPAQRARAMTTDNVRIVD